MDVTTLTTALNTIAQCAAALAALIGFLGLWRLDQLRGEWQQRLLTLYRINGGRQFPVGDEYMLRQAQDLIKDWETRLPAQRVQSYEESQVRQAKAELACLCELNQVQHWLLGVLRIFLIVTLLILGAAVAGFLVVDWLTAWRWTRGLLAIAAGWLTGGPILVVWMAAPRLRREQAAPEKTSHGAA